jgi:hypothetical protein
VSDARRFQDACAEAEASRPARGNNKRSSSQVMTKTKMAPPANRMKTAKGMKAYWRFKVSDALVQNYEKHLAETIQKAAEGLSLRTIKGNKVAEIKG